MLPDSATGTVGDDFFRACYPRIFYNLRHAKEIQIDVGLRRDLFDAASDGFRSRCKGV